MKKEIEKNKSVFILMLLILPLIIFGCLSEANSYDVEQLKKENQLLAEELESQTQKINNLKAQLSDCSSRNSALENLLKTKTEECVVFANISNRYENLKPKLELIKRYKEVYEVYNEYFEKGKTPTYKKINQTEMTILSLNNSLLYAKWKGLFNCTTYLNCREAQLSFLTTLQFSVANVSFQLSEEN
jgi:hypothetical protein